MQHNPTTSASKQCTRCGFVGSADEFIKLRCRQCESRRLHDWYVLNKERHLTNAKRWAEFHRAELSAYHAQYYQANKTTAAGWSKASREHLRKTDPERLNRYSRDWYARNRDQHYATTERYRRQHLLEQAIKESNRRSRKAQNGGSCTRNDIAVIYERQGALCAGCSIGIETAFHIDHIMPLALGGTGWPDNLQLLCPTCNLRKGSMHPDKWKLRLSQGPV